jgi:hypothetical protein
MARALRSMTQADLAKNAGLKERQGMRHGKAGHGPAGPGAKKLKRLPSSWDA